MSKPPKYALEGWGGWRARLDRMCGDQANEACQARGRAHGVAVKYRLDRVPESGVIAGFFQMTKASADESQYKMKKEMRGYFLVITKAAAPKEGEGRWQLVGIGRDYSITVIPGVDSFGRYIRCPDKHAPTHTAAGFESCASKHRAMRGLLPADSGLAGLNALEAALSDPDSGVMASAQERDEFMWTTCHLGCCRAQF